MYNKPILKEGESPDEQGHQHDAHGDVHASHVHALLCQSFDGLSDKRLSRSGIVPMRQLENEELRREAPHFIFLRE